MKFFKNKDKKKSPQLAVVKPQVKGQMDGDEKDDGYVAVTRAPPVPKPPKIKKRKKEKVKQRHKKELPPLPAPSNQEHGDYEVTEVR